MKASDDPKLILQMIVNLEEKLKSENIDWLEIYIEDLIDLLWKRFITTKPTDDNLSYIVQFIDIESLKEKAAREIMKRKNPKSYQLYNIMKHIKSVEIKEQAADLMMKLYSFNENLCYVIELVETRREKAWQMLTKQNPTDYDLDFLRRYVPEMSERISFFLKEKEYSRI